MTQFSGAQPALADALNKRGYTELTPVQQAVLEDEVDGRDLLVSAQTGSGKTVAFGLACAPTLLGDLERFGKPHKPMALIIAPTRELALQVKLELTWLYAQTGAAIASCVGGMDIRTERRNLERGAHIVVGTPGRLRDHISRNALDTTAMKAVVLDEADEMLDLGFREDLEFILEAMPESRRTLMFSATVPHAIAKLAKDFQTDALRLSTKEEARQHGDIEYRALVCAPRERENAIVNVLRYYEAQNALVFCNTRAAVNHMVARLNNRGFSVVALSGELSQNERTHALQAMRDGRARVCVATDVAARGIDLPKLELVVHSDLPTNPETLLHRSGRTGRAGRKGVSALMVDQKGRGRAERLLRFAKLTAEWASPPSADEVNAEDEKRLMTSPLLLDPMGDEQAAFVAQLVENFTPEQLATALLRAAQGGKSAPEDIQKLNVHEPRAKIDGANPRPSSRESFTESVWVSLSVGRKQRAEPRWLIPMLCKNSVITKANIGHIKMQPDETYVQLDAGIAADFMESLNAGGILEDSIRVTQLPGEPTDARSKPHFKSNRSQSEGREDRKPHRKGGGGFKGKPKAEDGGGAKKPFGKNPSKKPADSNKGTGEAVPSGKPKKAWSKEKPGGKAGGKSKPYPPKAGAKSSGKPKAKFKPKSKPKA